jgi:hypothetical protein
MATHHPGAIPSGRPSAVRPLPGVRTAGQPEPHHLYVTHRDAGAPAGRKETTR